MGIPPHATVTQLQYFDVQAGILCKVDFDSDVPSAFVSITHLRFDPRLPFARRVNRYQKQRLKRLRRRNE